jgi:hypothetical protein
MLTARSVIITVIVLVIVSLASATISLLKSPDRSGLGSDSFGTRAGGYRAIFDTLGDLGYDIQRGLLPPSERLDDVATVILWAPLDDLVQVEPVYFERLAKWVGSGGRVVLAPQARRESSDLPRPAKLHDLVKPTTAAEELGLAKIDTEMVDLSPAGADQSAIRRKSSWDSGNIGTDLQDYFNPQLFALRTIPVRATGSLTPLAASVAMLEIPQQLEALKLGDTQPQGRITVVADDGKSYDLAADFKVGEGDVIVISDQAIFDNRSISEADNSVLAAYLIAERPGKTVWDEFYHGLTVRGNPLFLLTRGNYAVVAIMIVAVTGVWVWRQAIFLGPAIAPPAVSRRTLREYVEAMARFIGRGAGSLEFMLAEVRRGVLWSLRNKFRLHGERETAEEIAAAIALRDPAAAQRLLAAVAAADRWSQQPRAGKKEFLHIVKGLFNCL